METGGYPAAVTRVGALLALRGRPLPLTRFELKKEVLEGVSDLLPELSVHEWKRVRGRQEIIVRYERDRAIETLPRLVAAPADREKLLALMERVLSDPRVMAVETTPAQRATAARIREVLGVPAAGAPARKRARTAGKARARGARR
jgi:hypothetical protein